MKEYKRNIEVIIHDTLHFSAEAYDLIEKEKYKDAQHMLFKMSNYLQEKMIEELAKRRRHDR